MPFSKDVAVKATQIFINNEYVNAIKGETFETLNPATNKVLAKVQSGTVEDIDAAVKAARAAFNRKAPWRTMNAHKRGSYLFKLADLIERDEDYLASLESLDCGKSPQSALGDINLAVANLRYCGGYADKIHGKTIPTVNNIMCITRQEPVGVVGGITPWNYPFHLAILKLSFALAAGCTMVLKPAEQTPLSTLYLGKLIKEAEFPAGVVNIVPGYGHTAGKALVDHLDVNKISFTGSTEVGRLILKGSGDSNIKRVTLELGGKSPVIVFDDAADKDFDQVASLVAQAAIINHGQCCIAGTRTYVQSSVYEKFLAKFKQFAESQVVGDPFDPKTDQGPQIDDTQTNKIMDYIKSGVEQGARLVTGGKRVDCPGNYIQPTIFADVTEDMKIAKEEIFGPVQCVMKFDTIDEVIDKANNTSYGLGAGIFTKSLDRALTVSQALEAGTVYVNNYLQVSPSTPFGGFKESGMGREYGKEGIHAYLEHKTIMVQLSQSMS